MNSRPTLVYADAQGNIYDWPELEMVGSSAGRWHRVRQGEWVPLPPGSELFLLPERFPVGYNAKRKRFEVLSRDPFAPGKSVQAVAAFMAPAYAQILSAAFTTSPQAPILPLFSYTAVGWHDGGFVATGLRVDPDQRQDHQHIDPHQIERNATKRMAAEPGNRLVQHLGKCALTYGCPAARNLFMKRWEAPLPTSPSCNARCLGCISLQEGRELCATQDRITFVPTPQEVAGVAVPHLETADGAVVSFGQGCEGEPLLQASVIEAAIRIMRRATGRGTINLNTNGSLPEKVDLLCRAGLDSIRVSLNSCRPEYYNAYYRPRGYGLDHLKRSVQAIKAHGGFASLNYLMLPGFSDEQAEWEALCRFIEESRVDLIQMRNLNIDPDWYLRTIGHRQQGRPMGLLRWMDRVRDRFPHIRFGYFNPCLDPEAEKPSDP